MIPSGVEGYVASTPVDFRKGPASLMALVRDGGVDPFNGALYVFRAKRADRVKIVWWDGSGVPPSLPTAPKATDGSGIISFMSFIPIGALRSRLAQFLQATALSGRRIA
jgi:hypothetical protein